MERRPIWSVYLPRGDWYEFWTGKAHIGARWIEAEAPLDRMTLLVRSGAIIPMVPVIQYDAEAPDDRALGLLIYPDSDSPVTICDDVGLTYAHERGARSLIEARCLVTEGVITVKMSSAAGEYVAQSPSRPIVFRIRVASVPSSICLADSGRVAQYGAGGQIGPPYAGWWYEDDVVCVATIMRRGAFAVEISPCQPTPSALTYARFARRVPANEGER